MRSDPRRRDYRPAQPLLDEARFAIPELSSFHQARPRVVEQFDRSEDLGLVVLVSAPAGTGKSTAVAEWVRSTGMRDVGWTTFENDDVTFWGHVLPCLRRLDVDVPAHWSPTGDAALGPDRILALSAALGAMPRRLTIVLDGYELHSREIGDELDFLLRHALGRLRLVFVSRVDPVFPFYRHAIAGSLDELRAADLAFTDAEAAELLGAAGLAMSPQAVHDLNERLHGWAAGLRLAARALVGRPEPERLLSDVLLQTSALQEFLVEEVLNRQSTELRRIVLDTSVPDSLCGTLVEEIAGAAASRAFDSFAELRGLVEPETGRPGWFRYPRFVRDLLRVELAYESPERAAEIHRVAAGWLLAEGLAVEALTHLVKASAWAEAAGAVVDGLLVGRLIVEGRDGPVAVLARGVPADLGGAAASLTRAAAALTAGDESLCDRELAVTRSVVADDGLSGSALCLSLAVVEAARACRTGHAATAADVASAAERALDEGVFRADADATGALTAVVQLSKGVAALRVGDLRGAREALTRVAECEPDSSSAAFRAERAGRRAVVEALEGNLTRSVSSAEDALLVAREGGVPPAEVPPAAYVALALVGVDRAEPDLTREYVDAARASPLIANDPTCRALVEAAEAALERVDGRLEAATARLEATAESVSLLDPWLADHLLLRAAGMSLAAGQPGAALMRLGHAHEAGRPEAAVLAAAAYEEQGDSPAGDRLATVVRRDDIPLQSRVTGLLVESLRRSRQRSPGRARQTLDDALYAARPEGLRRPFLEAGPSVRRWLNADPHFAHASAWLDVSNEARPSDASDDGLAAVLPDPLTAKELEVLELLAALLTTDEIAEKLFVSVNTVRTHIRSILRKLGVGRRNAAIRRARELRIIAG